MSGDGDTPTWNVDSLHEHFSELRKSDTKAIEAALAAADKATTKAEEDGRLWRAATNEWRSAMDDRETRFAQKAEVELRFKADDDRISAFERARENETATDRGAKASTMKLIAAVTSVAAVIGVVVAIAALLAK